MPHPQIVGVLNVTPDSFYDGGKFSASDAAIAQAETMIADGADIIEVGGESTGPNSPAVSLDQERERVIPILKAIRQRFPEQRLSVDTYKSAIAEEAIAAGASMINDVTAGRSDPRLFEVISAAQGVSLVLMYSKDSSPRTTVASKSYDDVIADVKAFLRERKQAAIESDVDASRIILDPGLGHFLSSDPAVSLSVLARLAELQSLGCPLFISPSRKSFLAGSENLATPDRLPGTIAASVIAVLNGATYIRTHDVLEVRRACEIAESIKNQ